MVDCGAQILEFAPRGLRGAAGRCILTAAHAVQIAKSAGP